MGWALTPPTDAFMKFLGRTPRKIASKDLESQKMWWSQNGNRDAILTRRDFWDSPEMSEIKKEVFLRAMRGRMEAQGP